MEGAPRVRARVRSMGPMGSTMLLAAQTRQPRRAVEVSGDSLSSLAGRRQASERRSRRRRIPMLAGGGWRRSLFFLESGTVFAPRRRLEDPYLAPPRLCTYNRVAVSSASPSNSLRTGIAALLPYDRNPPCRRSAERTTTTT